jgi:hypothetical protein
MYLEANHPRQISEAEPRCAFGSPTHMAHRDSRFLSLLRIMSTGPRPPRDLDIANVNPDWKRVAPPTRPVLIEHACTVAGTCHALTSLAVSSMALLDTTISQCFQLKERYLDSVWCAIPPSRSAREYQRSAAHRVIERILLPGGPRLPVASLSHLRTLKVIPEHQEDMAIVLPIFDVAYSSLGELRLIDSTCDPSMGCLLLKQALSTDLRAGYEDKNFPFAGLVNFQQLSHLRLIGLRCTIYDSDAMELG